MSGVVVFGASIHLKNGENGIELMVERARGGTPIVIVLNNNRNRYWANSP